MIISVCDALYGVSTESPTFNGGADQTLHTQSYGSDLFGNLIIPVISALSSSKLGN